MGFFSNLFKRKPQNTATTLIPRPDLNNKFYRMAADPRLIWQPYNEQRAKIAKELQNLNISYMLGLPDLTKEQFSAVITADTIVHAHNPFQAFAERITPGKPTIAEFCLSMEATLARLMEEIQLDEEDMGNIYIEFLSMTAAVTDELIDEIVQSFASTLPPQMHFLKDKVNYELACLGHIMQYGINQNRQDICQKVNVLRQKRGYTN